MSVLCLCCGMVFLGLPSTLVFLGPEDLSSAENVRVEAQVPSTHRTLVPKDPAQPGLWFSPAAAIPAAGETWIWYQRVNKAETEYADQRTLCLGILRDGAWTCPEVNPTPPARGGPNNVVLTRSPHPPTWGGFNVFQILKERQQYRMLYWDQPESGPAGGMLAASLDGVHWQKDPPAAVFTEHNDAFSLLKKDGKYLLYQTMLEDWPDKPYPDNLDKKRRVQSLRESYDLLTWTPQKPLLRPDAEDPPETEFYLMKPFAYGGRYAALLFKYFADPNAPNKHSAKYAHELIVSADARAWVRPFRSVDLGVWTYADPFMDQGQLCFVYGKDSAIDLACYRKDGLTAAAAEEPGQFTTKTFSAPSGKCFANLDARQGWVEFGLLSGSGQRLPGLLPCRIEGIEGTDVPLPLQIPPQIVAGIKLFRFQIRMAHARLFAVTGA